MRFSPERTDEANAGLGIVRDLLLPIKKAHPEISFADLWVLGGHVAVEFLGGPNVPFRLGRTDTSDGFTCPANGRLPDAAQGMFRCVLFFYLCAMILVPSHCHTAQHNRIPFLFYSFVSGFSSSLFSTFYHACQQQPPPPTTTHIPRCTTSAGCLSSNGFQ